MGTVKLYDTLKAGYGDKKSVDKLREQGYTRDDSLSNDNTQVYYNKRTRQMVYNVSGTHNLKDWATDFYLLKGKVKDTNRYKQAERNLQRAKDKYKPRETAVSGHSLGGTIAQGIKKNGDKESDYNAGYTFFQKSRSNHGESNHLRTGGDIVSALSGNSKNIKTIKSKSWNPLTNHAVENLKDSDETVI